jgi:hypothetical protein
LLFYWIAIAGRDEITNTFQTGTQRSSPSRSSGVSELSGSPTNLYAVDKLLKDELIVIKFQEREEGLDSGEVRGL